MVPATMAPEQVIRVRHGGGHRWSAPPKSVGSGIDIGAGSDGLSSGCRAPKPASERAVLGGTGLRCRRPRAVFAPAGALGSRHGRSEAQPEDRFHLRHLTRQEEAHPPRWSCESSGMSGGAGGSSLAQPFNKRGGTSELGQIASASTAVTWAGNAVAQPVCAAVMGAMSGAVRPGRSEIGVGVDHEVGLPRLKVRIRTGVVISHLYKLDFMDSAARTGTRPTATRAVNRHAAETPRCVDGNPGRLERAPNHLGGCRLL